MDATRLFLLGTTLIVWQLGRVDAVVGEGDNAAHYDILCRVYNVAKNPPSCFANASEEAIQIAEAVDVLEVAVSDPAWVAGMLKAESPADIVEPLSPGHPDVSKDWKRWKKAVTRAEQEGSRFPNLGVNGGLEIPLAKIRRINEKVRGKLKRFDPQAINRTKGEANTHFNRALWGAEGSEPGEAATLTVRANADGTFCGKGESSTGLHTASAAAGTQAGTSLLADFLCLCAYQSSGVAAGVCGSGIGASSGGGTWAPNAGTNGGKSWASIKKGCENKGLKSPATLHEARLALHTFWNTLSTPRPTKITSATKVISGLLGTCEDCESSTYGCDGNTAHGICVYYGKPPGWAAKLSWYKEIQDGLSILERLQNETSAAQHELTELKILETRAEEIYEDAKATVGNQKINSNKTTQIEGGAKKANSEAEKATAQEHQSVNLATIHHFLLPWTLLL